MFALLVFILLLLGVSLAAHADSAVSAPSVDPALPPISEASHEQITEVGESAGPATRTVEILTDEAQDDAMALEGGFDKNQEPNLPTSTASSLLHGLAFSDAVIAILEDSTASWTLISSNVIVDFETQAALIVESYRSDLAGIVHRTLRQRRRRRRQAADGNQDPDRFRISNSASHEVRFSPAVVSELSRAAGDVTDEVERRQLDQQKRRVRRKAILLAPLIFVDRPNRSKVNFLSSAAFTARFETPALFFLEQPSSLAVQQSTPQQAPRRRKRSHRGFETFSQVDGADRDRSKFAASTTKSKKT
jgi:hypothetical protein